MDAVMQSKDVAEILSNFIVVKSSSNNPEVESWNVEYLPTFYFLDATGTKRIGTPHVGFFEAKEFMEILKKYIQ